MTPEIAYVLPARFRTLLERYCPNEDRLREIRFRIGQPVEILDAGRRTLGGDKVTKQDLKEMLEYISGYSLYAFEEEISQGFLTIQGGHRVGMAGHVVMEDGRVKNIRNISFINIRISHQVKGCAKMVMEFVRQEGDIHNTLVISPPGCGKTTLLRDMVRLIAGESNDVMGKTITVVDERSEIAGCYRGVPQNDLGCRTDVLDGCPKSQGMMMAVRSLSPEVIVVDEIGDQKDVQALRYAMNCGCSLIASVHGKDLQEVKDKPELGSLITDGLFQRFVVLKNMGRPGKICDICDERGRSLWHA